MTNRKSGFLLTVSIVFISVVFVLGGCSSSVPSGQNSVPPKNEVSLVPLAPAPAAYTAAPVEPVAADFSLSAVDFVAQMDAGWNLGNTLDAHSSGRTGLATETSWGQPRATREMIKGLRDSGIKTVRIPVTWHNHVDNAFTVDPEWMNRVREVVDFAVSEDLFVIINMHHDIGVNYYYPDRTHFERSLAFVTRIWEQIALTFRNYDEHLIFEILNEPRLAGQKNEWGWDDSFSSHVEAAGIIGELEQTALDRIRTSGSNNAQRYVMITPYVASPRASFSDYFEIPEDSAADKLIISVHAYSPYPFAMQDPGEKAFTNAHKGEINTFMDRLNAEFVSKGRPVIIGEYGATNKENLKDRVSWFSYYCGRAARYGICTILWDNGHYMVPASGSFSELYGFYNRAEYVWYFPEILAAILEAYR
ncbi:MAG: glycoside hydrolase family 5 protein [Spirochaetales bacterium]|nr:glycoside hydrolase family 5 protein [Spirochaetales bacterium]